MWKGGLFGVAGAGFGGVICRALRGWDKAALSLNCELVQDFLQQQQVHTQLAEADTYHN